MKHLFKFCGIDPGTCGSTAALFFFCVACAPPLLEKDGLEFSHWRITLPTPDAEVGAAYGTITNTTAQPVTLQSASFSCAEKTELHETLESGGRVRMVMLESVVIGGRAKLEFLPGKKHAMLTGIRHSGVENCTATFTVGGHSYSFRVGG